MSSVFRDEDVTPASVRRVVASMVRGQKPDVVVEAGTGSGHTAHAIARALERNGHGHLYTADVTPPDKCDLWNFGSASPFVSFYRNGFMDMLDQLEAVDFAFIDASRHLEDGTRDASIRWTHFTAALDRLRGGGMICVHDTATDDWTDGECGASVRRIRDACQLNLRFGKGLSIYHAP